MSSATARTRSRRRSAISPPHRSSSTGAVISRWSRSGRASSSRRTAIAAAWRSSRGRARAEGETQGYSATVSYDGQEIVVGTWAHWQLMERACRAKFEQDEDARAALLATGDRPLTHIVRRDSKAIPGVVMADIWMRIRDGLRQGFPAGKRQ